ncbi:MFS general substrate transporter [Pisolithus orientalis]|uniref:MFS general substrate transporter n=1 Tax=Pisolithus orientalis TaxID=936130 RepID=UPI002224A000|nr:MFS general substrate transporter [Pisolithus orientalis]KAI5990302.1 MFS general substrate transporter [Pisolithus orientalis]
MSSSLSDTLPDKNSRTFGVSDAQGPAQMTLGPERERRLWWKIDFRLVPMISLMYLFSFMDRGNAKLEGLTTQLHLTGSRYNVALVSGIMASTRHVFLTKLNVVRVLHSKLSPTIKLAWGVIMTFMGLVKSYPQLVAMRFLLGVAEAGFYPGVTFYLSMWYPRLQIDLSFSPLYWCSSSSGYGHPVADRIIQGLATIVICFVGALVLADYPDTARFLSPEERQFVEQQRTLDIEEEGKGTVTQHILSAFTDWQVWAMGFVLMSFDVPIYGITFFLPFGYNTAISQLLTVPVYVAATLFMITAAHFSDTMKIRFPFIIASEIVGLVGYIIQITDASTGVKYFGTYLVVIGIYTGIPCVVGWLANNLHGKYKRGAGTALQVGMGNLGGIIASYIFRTQDEPRYVLGFAIEIGFLCMGMIVTAFSAYAYHRANTARIARAKRDGINEAKYAVDIYAI